MRTRLNSVLNAVLAMIVVAPALVSAAGYAHLQRYEVPDAKGFERPMTAMSVLAPIGWRAQGGVVWQANTSGCGPTTPHTNWTALAPDGIGAIAILPQESWTGFDYPALGTLPQQGPCPNFRPTNGRDFVLGYVARHRPGARVLDYQDRTAEFAEVQRMVQSMNPPMAGMETRVWIEGGLALVAYTVNGQEVREVVGTAVMFNVSRMSDYMGGYMDSYLAFAFPGFGFRAANGQLDFNVAETVRKSLRENPQWSRRMAEHHRRIAKINAKGARDRAEITRRSNQEIFDMQQESWRSTQASNDRLHREFTESIRGVETYNDPYYGDTVQLDNTYDNAWQLKDGTYVLTDDPTFEPNAVFGQDGVQLKRTP